DGHVVHRVLAVRNEGVITRGDNNRFTDLGRIKGENIVGRVAEVFSPDRAIVIHGGARGLFIHYALRFGLYGKMILKPLLKRMGVSQIMRRGLHKLFLRAFICPMINHRPTINRRARYRLDIDGG
ncbi:MAG: hypothetical protein ONB12_08295, partial [candidate division KSB1 bacterium]|nr:hypothetical protein [candidate division KSB1 bacterium]